jgi:hypothetical protein
MRERSRPEWSTSTRTTCTTLVAGAIAVACNAVLGNEPGELADAGGSVSTDAAAQSTIDPGSVGPNVDDAASTNSAPPSGSDDAGNTGSDDAATPGACAQDQKSCNGECFDVDDPTHGCATTSCSACVVANAVAACAGGACAIESCADGFGDCNRDPSDGCEVDFSKPSSCGSCKNKCNGDTPACAPVGGSYACTKVCPLTAPTLCGKECANLLTNVAHCGTCGTACATAPNSTVSCLAGVCAMTCNTGFMDCDGNASNGCEAALDTDANNCGACGVVCPKGPCSAGTCKTANDDAGTASPDAGTGGGDTVDADLDVTG